ncbi:hypothetical protein COB64_00285 [Candidatus Wolfebacteria bacterium]|nr:MAG: hypothetical protein COB64_00285 [Candidatus Wolfebacteria bacterium]
MNTFSTKRTIIAGIISGIAVNIAGFFTFALLGMGLNFNGILLRPGLQNEKIIAVWKTLEPLPLAVTAPVVIALGYLLLAVVYAFVYRWIAPVMPQGIKARALRISLFFITTFLFWELNTPINLFSEPFPLAALDVLYFIIMACAGAFAMAWAFERRRK